MDLTDFNEFDYNSERIGEAANNGALSKRTTGEGKPVTRPLERVLGQLEGKEAVMLVLSRKKNQKIVLPSIGTTIEVLEIKGNTVRIGIIAPNEIPVIREELRRRIEDEAASADQEAACC
jgi:carbon storage regulator CsrA